ncbi:MAG: hypothetical protein AAGJ97_02130 [Planctomycetota bacterium]
MTDGETRQPGGDSPRDATAAGRLGRGFASLFIVGYLGLLAFGFGAHTLKWGHASHPGMYFIVWDMFCGWSAWDTRTEVIGLGESGRFYELAPGPWGEVATHGRLDRRHYDIEGVFACRIALNTLAQTEHEPIDRIFVVERSHPKKYNVTEPQWAARYGEPRQTPYYHRLRHVITAEGRIVRTQPSWFAHLKAASLSNGTRVKPMPGVRPMMTVSRLSDRQRGRISAGLPTPELPPQQDEPTIN